MAGALVAGVGTLRSPPSGAVANCSVAPAGDGGVCVGRPRGRRPVCAQRTLASARHTRRAGGVVGVTQACHLGAKQGRCSLLTLRASGLGVVSHCIVRFGSAICVYRLVHRVRIEVALWILYGALAVIGSRVSDLTGVATCGLECDVPLTPLAQAILAQGSIAGASFWRLAGRSQVGSLVGAPGRAAPRRAVPRRAVSSFFSHLASPSAACLFRLGRPGMSEERESGQPRQRCRNGKQCSAASEGNGARTVWPAR